MSERPPSLGTLRDRVQILRKDMAPEAEGGHAVTYVPISTVWGRVRTLSGRSTERGDGRTTALSHAIVLRYRTDIAPGDRLSFRGRVVEIVSAEDLNGRRAYLSCVCTESLMKG